MKPSFAHLHYLMCFFLPLACTAFFLSAHQDVISTLAWTLPCWLILLADYLSPHLQAQPAILKQSTYYDWILYGLVGLQLLNMGLMLDYVNRLDWHSGEDYLMGIANIIVIRFLLGTSSGISGVVVAHELMHRPQASMQCLARLMLLSLCYDHFALVHKQGHHRGVKQYEDFTTARLDESFQAYWQRVYWRQLQYAWQVAQTQLLDEGRRLNHWAFWRNQVVRGFLLEVLIVLLIFWQFGWLASALFLYQAFIAVRIIEAINYVQHWGLTDPRYSYSFGWVNDGLVTYYLLLGLSHHIGHHQDESQAYYAIPYSAQGPKMPHGYLVMNLWIKLHNPSYQRMARQALEDYKAVLVK